MSHTPKDKKSGAVPGPAGHADLVRDVLEALDGMTPEEMRRFAGLLPEDIRQVLFNDNAADASGPEAPGKKPPAGS